MRTSHEFERSGVAVRLHSTCLVLVVMMGGWSGCLSSEDKENGNTPFHFPDPCESGIPKTTWYHFTNATPADSIAWEEGWQTPVCTVGAY